MLSNPDGFKRSKHVHTHILDGHRYFRFLLGFGIASAVVGLPLSLPASAGFVTGPSYPAGGDCYALGLGDFNGDGVPDLAVLNNNSYRSDDSTVSILLGNRDGTLQPAQSYTVGRDAVSVAVGDFNGDGHLDILVSNQEQGVLGTLSLLLGNGDGTFQQANSVALSFAPGCLAAGDFNGDGYLDIVVMNYSSGGGLAVMLGNGDGTFRAGQTMPSGAGPFVVDDFNRDGNLDLALFGEMNKVIILLGNGDGTFQPPLGYAAGYQPIELAAGDFNGDGVADLAVADLNGELSILLGKGDGSFQPPITISGGVIGTLGVADFNADGYLDIASADDGVVTIFLGNGDGTFQAPVFYGAAYGPLCLVAAADFNSDGQVDLAVANRGAGTVTILLGNGDGTFQAAPGLAPGGYSVVVADLNGDGILDLAVPDGAAVNVLLGKGDGRFQPPQQAPGSGGIVLAVGDFNGDGIPDLASVGGAVLQIMLGNGDGTFQPATSYPAGQGPLYLAVADLNGDGKQDIVTVNFYALGHTVLENDVRVFRGNGDGTFQAPQTFPADNVRYAMGAVADFNGDGIPDLVTTNGELDAVNILLGKGDGTFQNPRRVGVGVSVRFVAAGDFNGDGIPDLVSVGQTSPDTALVSIRLGNGDGTFKSPRYYQPDFIPEFVAVADFNRDGMLDLAISSEAGLAVLLGNGDGTFQAPQDFTAGSGGTVAVGDLNGDGCPDLVLTNRVTTLLINDGHWPP